jgi:hypothetical protein
MAEINSFYEKDFKASGLNPDDYTDEQMRVIMKPLDAPEDYYQDGEVNDEEAEEIWVWQMQQAEISPIDIIRIKRFVFA